MRNPNITAIQSNLFPAAHAAIPDWESFPWHHGASGEPDTQRLNSSQALAIDVFGTLMKQVGRTRVLNLLAGELGLPRSQGWDLLLEWIPASNPLKEIHQHTQVDVLAESEEGLLFFECKFTEHDGGACSQTEPLAKGAHRGLRQCNGNYALQTNPANGKTSRCALSAKGIRYWEVIPEVFQLDAGARYCPCPFAGSWYQWMRNITHAYAIAKKQKRSAAVCLVYADAPGLAVAEMVGSNRWQDFLALVRPEKIPVRAISYQEILNMASEVDPDPIWEELRLWVGRKIALAT